MKEILPTQFEDAPLKVEGSLLGKICRAISSLKPSIGWGLRASQTDAGFHFEVDRDQIKDPQLKLMQVISIEESADGSYPEVIKAAPPGNRDDIHVVSIATPELKAGLLEADANDPSYDNAYHEYIETVWRKSGVIRFVGFRLAAPTGNFAVDGDGYAIDVYWLAEAARVQNFVINNLSGDPWISVGIDAIDLGQVDDEGEPIFSVVSKVKHKEVTNADPSLQYDTAETGSTNQSLSLVTWANPNLTITPVTLAQDDAGHIHTFTAGGDTVANLAGASDELVASQAGQVAGYLEDVAAAADPWTEINTNGADVEWGHADADPNGNGAGIGADSEIKAGDAWTLIRNNADPALGAASDAAFDEKGHYYDGDRWVFHADAQASVLSLTPMGSYTAPNTSTLRLPASSVPVDDKGHVNTGESVSNDRDIQFTSSDSSATITVTAAGGNGTVDITGTGDGHGFETVTTGATTLNKEDGGIIEFLTTTASSGAQSVDFSQANNGDTAEISGEVDIDAYLKALSGYSGVKKQVLVNDNGTIKWVDTAECP